MIERAEVERRIVDEESMLDDLAALLESGSDLAAWPDDVRTALALALADGSMSRSESWKAVALCRHLFGPEAAVPAQIAARPEPSTIDRKRSERLRSGLSARVRYRAGMYLLRGVGSSR